MGTQFFIASIKDPLVIAEILSRREQQRSPRCNRATRTAAFPEASLAG